MTTLVQQYFIESAARFPDKPAFCCEQQAMSFSEADAFTNAFARFLQSHGVQRGQLVPFFLPKSVNSMLSILSILKADCAYVPVDVKSPAQRLASILQATRATVVVVDDDSQRLFESLVPQDQRPRLLNIAQFTPQGPADSMPVEAQNLSIDMAYVLFTSGSTGVPKGVMIPHKAIIDYIDWCVETYGLTSDDVFSQHAPLYFDNSTFDIYCAFKTGGTLHLVHDELNAMLPRMVKWLQEREVTTFFCVPSVLTLLLSSRRLKPDSFPRLRHVLAAGEVLPRDVLDGWMALYPHIQFTNMYGPTEITVDCTYHVMQARPPADMLSIPIGRARRNMELFVRLLDGTLTQEEGAQGELLVRGTSVAYGYLDDPERTAKVFIQNPNNPHFHDLLYCTGDLVRLMPGGEFNFLGRADDQIKHLGYRIELGEIEAQLVAVPGVEEGVVTYRPGASGADGEIGALYSVSTDMSVAELRAALQARLPGYMVPAVLKPFAQEFPRTPNGKYDRKQVLALTFAS